MTRLYFNETSSDVAENAIPQWPVKLTACAGVLFVAILCAATPNLGTRAAVVFTTIKVRVYDHHSIDVHLPDVLR